MARPKLTEKQLAILKWIAENGATTEYQLTKQKEIGISDFTAHQAPNLLVKKGLLKSEPKGKARTGKTIKTYQLTIEGLFEVLKETSVWGHIDNIISVNEQLLPEYFGLWKKFKEMKVDDVAAKLFTYTITKLQEGVPSFPKNIGNRKPTLRDWLPRMAIYPWDALNDKTLTEQETKAFLRVIIADERANKLYVDTLQWMIDSYRSAMQGYKYALKKYKEVKYLVDVAVQGFQHHNST